MARTDHHIKQRHNRLGPRYDRLWNARPERPKIVDLMEQLADMVETDTVTQPIDCEVA
jgi:hypothetical protein